MQNAVEASRPAQEEVYMYEIICVCLYVRAFVYVSSHTCMCVLSIQPVHRRTYLT